MKNYDRSGGWSGGLMLIGFVLVAAFVVGWWFNIVKLAVSDFEQPVKPELIRIVGVVVVPVGAVVGYMEFEGEDEGK